MKNRNLISISGDMGSGKDTVGATIQMLIGNLLRTNMYSEEELMTKHYGALEWYKKDYSGYTIKKFADKLKDIACILLGCTREQLEIRDFKEKELGEEWWKYAFYRKGTRKPLRIYATLAEAEEDLKIFKGGRIEVLKLTPRLLLQLLGTEAGRDIIHTNIWCNALMSEYKSRDKGKPFEGTIFQGYIHTSCKGCKQRFMGYKQSYYCNTCIEDDTVIEYPRWIVTDTRFPNEIAAIEKFNGIKIKVVNPRVKRSKNPHDSETALDNYTDWDYIIINDGDLKDLKLKVREILKNENLIE